MASDHAVGCGVGIVGLGAGLPTQVRGNDFWSEQWQQSREEDFARKAEMSVLASGDSPDEAAAIKRVWDDVFKGAVERRVIASDQNSSDLELRACADALAVADLQPSDIDLLIGYSQVPDEAEPPNHGHNSHRLGLPLEATVFTLDAGCASFLPHLTTAVRLIQSGDNQRALIYQSSASSRIIDYNTPSSPYLGDGAMAAVVAPVPTGLGMVGRVQLTRGELYDAIVLARPHAAERWHEAPTTDEPMVSFSRNVEHARVMGAHGPAFCRETCHLLLQRHGLTPADVDFFVCAQSTAWWADACAKAAEIPDGRYVTSKDHFERFGHLLPASAPLNLWLAWTAGRLHIGDLVLVYTPGAGFIQTATLLRWALA